MIRNGVGVGEGMGLGGMVEGSTYLIKYCAYPYVPPQHLNLAQQTCFHEVIGTMK